MKRNKAGSRVRSRYFWLVEVIKHRLQELKEEYLMLCRKNAQNRKENIVSIAENVEKSELCTLQKSTHNGTAFLKMIWTLLKIN